MWPSTAPRDEGASDVAPDRSNRQSGRLLGLPLIAIFGLALLTVPRVVLHDLHLIEEGTFVNLVFVVVPIVIWVVTVVVRRVPNPFVTLLAVGAVSGLFLALGHQLLWEVSFGDNPPRLGGNLADLAPGVQSVIMRGFATISSVFTGLMVGAVSGLVAWGIAGLVRLTRR